MSRIKLYWPVEDESTYSDFERSQPVQRETMVSTEDANSAVLSFSAFALRRRPSRPADPAVRARIMHANRTCPDCGRSVIEPLELKDAALNRNRMPIPGTATLVGFHCHSCGTEWPAAH